MKGSILAAGLTPLRADRTIDDSRFAEHTQWLLDNGCDSVVLFGTTGEGNSFSVAERMVALDALAVAGIDRSKLVVGTGCCALPDTVALTRHALQHGVRAVLVLPPFYYKTVNDDGLFDSIAGLIDTVADSALRIWLYHFPRMAVVSYSPALVERLVDAFGDYVVGIKDSTGDAAYTGMLHERFPSLDVFAGNESFLLDFLRQGGAGCISATANVSAPLAARVRDLQDRPDADALQKQLGTVRAAFEQFPMIAALKAWMARRTSRADWALVREPLAALGDADAAALEAELQGLL